MRRETQELPHGIGWGLVTHKTRRGCLPAPAFCDAIFSLGRLEHLGLSWPRKGVSVCETATAQAPLLNRLLFQLPQRCLVRRESLWGKVESEARASIPS